MNIKTIKNIGYILSFLLFTISCKKNTSSAEIIETKVSGQITNHKTDSIKLQLEDTTLVSALDSNGHYNFNFRLKDESNYKLKYGQKFAYVYLIPGDSLFVSTTEANLEKLFNFGSALQFSGDDSAVKFNSYFKDKNKYDGDLNKELQTAYSLEETDFLKKTDSLYNLKLQFINDKLKKHSIKIENFKTSEITSLEFEKALKKLNYPVQFYRLNKKEVVLSEDYYDFIDSLNINDSRFLKLESFKSFLNPYVNMEARKIVEKDSTLVLTEHLLFEVANDKLINQDIKNYYYFTTISWVVKIVGPLGNEDLMNKFFQLNTDKDYEATIKGKIDKWDHLKPGNIAPNITLETVGGEKKKLSDYYGAYLYIDAWATWCAPCIAENPALKKIANDYGEENLKILTVSIDKTKEVWKEYLQNKESVGKQLYADGAFKSNFAEQFKIKSIPRFILLDPKGKIVDVNAPRPSKKELRTVLDSIFTLNSK